jgi:outer membrane lipoprotein carrier protein
MRLSLRLGLAAALAFSLAALPAAATGLDQLRAFLDGAKSGRAAFRQVVTSKSARVPQTSAGTFAFARPGKFRWTYDKPFDQLIVGDGERLWIHDRDLNQVIVRRLDRALGTSPAALLAGDNTIEKNFDVTDGGSADGLDLVVVRPRTQDAGFERVRIGFRDNLPRMFELADTFGNVTTLTFTSFERNVALDGAAFRFVPPAGADVVGEDR